MRHSTLARFQHMSRLEERMLRATMPRTSAASPDRLPLHGQPAAGQPAALPVRRLRLVAKPLTYTLAEVR